MGLRSRPAWMPCFEKITCTAAVVPLVLAIFSTNSIPSRLNQLSLSKQSNHIGRINQEPSQAPTSKHWSPHSVPIRVRVRVRVVTITYFSFFQRRPSKCLYWYSNTVVIHMLLNIDNIF